MFSWIDITIPAIEPINDRIDIIATYVSNGSMAATQVIGTPNNLIITKNMLKLNTAPNIYFSSSLISSIYSPSTNNSSISSPNNSIARSASSSFLK